MISICNKSGIVFKSYPHIAGLVSNTSYHPIFDISASGITRYWYENQEILIRNYASNADSIKLISLALLYNTGLVTSDNNVKIDFNAYSLTNAIRIINPLIRIIDTLGNSTHLAKSLPQLRISTHSEDVFITSNNLANIPDIVECWLNEIAEYYDRSLVRRQADTKAECIAILESIKFSDKYPITRLRHITTQVSIMCDFPTKSTVIWCELIILAGKFIHTDDNSVLNDENNRNILGQILNHIEHNNNLDDIYTWHVIDTISKCLNKWKELLRPQIVDMTGASDNMLEAINMLSNAPAPKRGEYPNQIKYLSALRLWRIANNTTGLETSGTIIKKVIKRGKTSKVNIDVIDI